LLATARGRYPEPATAAGISPEADRVIESMYGVLEWPEEGRRERLAEGESVLGRGQEAQVRIADMQVGRRHAVIEAREDGRYLLRDLGSVNGTWFNAERVYERLLEPLDEFRLGGPQGALIRFLLWDEEWDDTATDSGVDMASASLVVAPLTAVAAQVRPNATMAVGVGDLPDLGVALPIDATKTAYIGLDMVRRRHLQLLVEGFGVQTFELSAVHPVTVGRDRMRNIVCLDHRSVSVEHAVIRIDEDGVPVVEDLHSTNGTFVNSERVEDTRHLREGDRLTFGHYRTRELIFRDSVPEEVEVRATDIAVGESMVIGRDKDSDLVLDHVLISRRHARIEHDERGYVVTDLKSANGTFVNGQRITAATVLQDNDRITIGPFLLQLEAGELRSNLDSSAIRIEAHHLLREVGPPSARKAILADVSVSIGRRELVGILGPSGSGKTTFLNAICGLQPADRGRVLFNGHDLYDNYDAAKQFIGFVPQHDDLHDELTTEQAFRFAARLRLPRDMSDADRQEHINRQLDLLEIAHRRDTRIGSLSGGQRKRVSIGIELLSQPGVLFVDEPTGGLDPRNQERMMYLFRRIASSGCTVVMATHQLGGFDLLDRSMVMHEGRLVYFGPVTQFYDYFDVNAPGDIYGKLETERSAEEWEERFQESSTYEQYVAHPVTLQPSVQDLPPVPRSQSALAQLFTLVARYGTQKLADRGGLITALLQAPIIGLLVLVIGGGFANGPRTLFMMVVAALWLGCSAGVREIVDEVEIYRRERLTFLKRWTYLGSKNIVLACLGLTQCLLLIGVLTAGGGLKHHFVTTTLILLLLYLGGVAGGLTISATVRSAAAAMAAVPLVMFPQILFAGLLVPTSDVPTILPQTVPELIEQTQEEGRKLQQLRTIAESAMSGGAVAIEVSDEGRETMGRFTKVTHGSRGVAVISTAMAARWGLEALCQLYVHDPFQLQVDSSEAYYQYQIANTVHLSLYSDEQREDLHDSLLSGDAAAGSASPHVLPAYAGLLLLHYFALVFAAWVALRRRDASIRAAGGRSARDD
jgi:ABC transport system ATP-binding/permease protein